VTAPTPEKGAIAWMVRNPVAANLLMTFLLLGGLLVGLQVKQEVFPEFDLDLVAIVAPYPGASPAEVEQGILLAIEEAVEGVDGIKRIRSSAQEGVGTVRAELLLGSDSERATSDIQNAIDRILTFPENAEKPTVQLAVQRQEVLTLLVHGDHDEAILHQIAEQIRDDLSLDPDITEVELNGTRPREISIEIPAATLRAHGLTLQGVAKQIRESAVELPGGGVKTEGGEILLRTTERRNLTRDFETIEIISRLDGTRLRLDDLATIQDGFEDQDTLNMFNGEACVAVQVFRVGDQTPITVANASRAYTKIASQSLPEGVSLTVWKDQSQIYRQRIDLLMRNAALGLVLVLLILGLFLELRLAFWVTMGIPISFLGSLFLMPALGVSINMISLFAFIVTLGMVVDDAIVVGENIFELRNRGEPPMKAAIQGTLGVARPVTFAILTTIATFMPMFFVPGTSGKLFRVIPAIVISVLLMSLVESLFVLPAHLAHIRKNPPSGLFKSLERVQRTISGALNSFIQRSYTPFVTKCVQRSGMTLAVCTGIFIVSMSYWASGRVDFTFMPKIELDRVTARIEMPFGVSMESTEKVEKQVVEAANAVLRELPPKRIHKGIFARIGFERGGGGPGARAPRYIGGHIGTIEMRFVPAAERDITVAEFVDRWRNKLGKVPGVEALTFHYDVTRGAGLPIDIELSHPNMEVLANAAGEIAKALHTFEGVRDIDDGFSPGKHQRNFRVTEVGRAAGVNAQILGRQLRAAFYGAEAMRQQRGRDEVRVFVRAPSSERTSEHDVDTLLIQTPTGGEMPIGVVASIERGRAFTTISRTDGRRVVNVTADVEKGVANGPRVLAEMKSNVLPGVLQRYAGLSYAFEGANRQQDDTLKSLGIGYIFALLLVYALLAIPFGSYVQPFVVMAAIPFGIVGALAGHLIMGFDMSIISLMGVVALSGVVVNDSLVLIDAANRYRDSGMPADQAVIAAGVRRFRPILLTSLTTFFGLVPMILETSVQARFLIPMAISLGFGILFATFIILLLVPALYTMAETWRAFFVEDKEETAVAEKTA